MNIKETFFIVSCFNAKQTQDYNEKAHAAQVASLKHNKVFFKEVNGVYKGKAEKALLLNCRGFAKAVAQAYEQECFLERGGDNSTYLINPKTETEVFIGLWKEIKKDQASEFEAYTHDPETDRYFVAVKG